MAEFNKVDAGYLRVVATMRSAFGDYTKTDVSFMDRDIPEGLYDLDNERCYLVKKDELDAYMARKEDLEKMNCTPVYDENQRLKARIHQLEVANVGLRDINNSWEEEYSKLVEKLEKENQSLKVKNGDLFKERGVLQANLVKCCKERDYWKDRFGSVVIDVSKVLEANGVEFTMRSIDGNKWNVVIDIPELNEAKAKVEELQKRGDYWKCESDAMNRNYRNLIQRHDAKWSAMTEALKAKGVEVLYMGEEDGKPNIDVKIPEIDTLKKELDDLKSKTVAEVRYEWKPNCFTVICTMRDGSKQTVGMDLADDTDEKCTMGAFVCRAFNIPQCKKCKNHRYYGKIGGHVCHLPDSKCIIPNTFDVFPLTDEEAEGPACDKFEARKE